MSVDDDVTTPAERAAYRRVLRRETHSPRAGAAVTVAVVLGLLGLGVGAGSIWLLVDAAARDAAVGSLGGLTSDRLASPVVLAAGIVAGLLGLWLALLALLPGRRARHGRFDGRIVVIAEDGVIADLVADRVARTLGVERTRIRATVGRRTAMVVVTPTSGLAVDRGAACGAVESATADLGMPLAARVVVAGRGVIA